MTLEATFPPNPLDQLQRRSRIGGRRIKGLSKLLYQTLHTFIHIIFYFPSVASSARRLQGLQSRIETLGLFLSFFPLSPLDVKPDSCKVGVKILFQSGKTYLLIAQRIFDLYCGKIAPVVLLLGHGHVFHVTIVTHRTNLLRAAITFFRSPSFRAAPSPSTGPMGYPFFHSGTNFEISTYSVLNFSKTSLAP